MSFIIAIGFALVLTGVARRVAIATGLVDRPAPEGSGEPRGDAPGDWVPLKVHSVPVPILGGIGVMVSVLLTSLLIFHKLPVAITAAVTLAVITGLVDDARPLHPVVRLVALTGSGLVMVAGGMGLRPLGPLAGAGLVVLVLLLSNAVNLIDGQDGLASGLGAIACAGMAAVAAAQGSGPPLVAVALAGSLVGFLAWNLSPARVFLGNSGAYGIGVLLAFLAARLTDDGWHGLIAAGLCLGVFAFELTFTVVRRLVSAQGLATGDRRHTYDLLARNTGSRDRATLLMWTLGAVAAGSGFMADQMSLAAAFAMAGGACAVGMAMGSRLWRQAMAMQDSP
jgi:UDP-GlcNAc:undecaprenyl-phosphate/decaprenyl-phosphate GlcNAc-1-phosphate transferase